jgi:hypothetical protein
MNIAPFIPSAAKTYPPKRMVGLLNSSWMGSGVLLTPVLSNN